VLGVGGRVLGIGAVESGAGYRVPGAGEEPGVSVGCRVLGIRGSASS